MKSNGSDPPEGRPDRHRILIVEDEHIVAMSLQAKLEALGYSVPATTGTGEDAIALATRLRPDLILMDIRLRGEMDGVAAARAIRDRLMVPVVFLTAYSTRDVLDRAKTTEPYGYILKPVNDRELHVVVEVAIFRHRAQQEILAQKRLLAATLQSIGDGVIATDDGGRVTFMNPVAERLTGRSLGDSLGQPIEAVLAAVDESTREPVEIPVRRAIQEKAVKPMGGPVALVRPDGTEVSIDDSAAPILDEAGNVLGGVLVFQDVTDKRAQQRRLSEMASIIESSEEAVIGCTTDGRITFWNPAAEKLYGYPANEVVGRDALTLLFPDSHRVVAENVLRRLNAGETVPPYETTRRRKDGTTFAASAITSRVLDERGRTVGFASFSRDITQLRLLEEHFRQSQRMEAVGVLAGGVAHDFNNLLTVISGYSKLLADEPLTAPQLQMVREVGEAGGRASGLTRQLLAFSRKQVLAPEVIDLNDIVSRAGRMLGRLIGEDIDLTLDLSASLDATTADPGQIEQVLMNLAVNARDAMPVGGRLRIATGNAEVTAAENGAAPGRYVRLEVSDTGCGMSDDVKARIFEPFFTTKGVGTGTGLGLAMVYGFVRQSNGHVAVSSAPGAGTTFTILLPRCERPARPEAREPARVTPPPRGGHTVLVAEDDPAVRKFIARILEKQGYVTLVAKDGGEALGIAAGHDGPIHLLVTDVVMPVMGGRPLAEGVRARRPDIKVLFVSGYMDDALLRHGVSNQTDLFLPKPFTKTELVQTVHKAVESPR